MKDRGIVTSGRFAALLLVAGAFACDGTPPPEPPTNRAPVAVGVIPPLTVVVGESATLDVSEYFSDPDGDALTYTATSSDNSVLTVSVAGSNVTATGVSAGTVLVAVMAIDPDGASASHLVDVTVQAANNAPVVDEEIADMTLTEGDTVAFDVAGNFSDPDGDVLTFTAESDDASVAAVSVAGSLVTVVGASPGTATITVTATDPGDLSASSAFTATVEKANQAPVAVGQIPPLEMEVGDTVTAPMDGFFSDPDGDTLTYAAESSDTDVVTVAMTGAFITVTAVGEGGAVVTITATDPGGLSATQTADITVEAANQAPVAVGQIPPFELEVGDQHTVPVSALFSDPDGDPLTYASESSDTTVLTASMTGSLVTITAVGEGQAVLTITATDPGGLSAQQTADVTVTKPNQAPVAVGQIPPLDLNVGDEFSGPVDGFFSDPDGDTLTFAAESSDTEVVTVTMNESLIKVRAVGEGEATVTVTATDPEGLSAEQTADVTVTKPNQAPELVKDLEHQTLTEGDTIMVDVAANFSDPDGDTLTFTVESDDAGVAVVSVEGSVVTIEGVAAGAAIVTVTATDPGGQSVAGAFAATVQMANQAPEAVGELPALDLYVGEEFSGAVDEFFSDPDGDTLTYAAESSNTEVVTVAMTGAIITVTAVGVGDATVTITATDPGGLSAEQTADISVTQPNRAPELVKDLEHQTLGEGDTIMVDVAANFSDPDGDTLTFTVESDDAGVAVVSVEGSVVTIEGVAAGAAIVTVTATDPGGQSVAGAFAATVQMGNQSPEAVGAIPPFELEVGDQHTVPVSGLFTDPDGDALTYAAESSDTTVLTASMTGALVTITAVGAGQAVLTITATDPGGLSAEQTANVTVTKPNQSPEAVGDLPAMTLTEGESDTTSVDQYFTDPDGDTLTYAAESSDPEIATAAMEGSVLTVTAVSPGEAVVTVTATDPGGLGATQSATVTVTAANQGPEVVEAIPNQTLTAGETVSVDVAGNFSDPDGDALTFAAESGDEEVATVAVDGSTVAITGVAEGEATITVTATDPGGLSVSTTFDAVVGSGNQAPDTVGQIPAQSVTVDATVTLAVSGYFTDPDGDALAYDASSSDEDVAGVAIEGDSVTITGVGEGTATLTVTATDPGGLSATQEAEVSVTPNNAPTVSDSIPVYDLMVVLDSTDMTQIDTLNYIELDMADYFSDPDGHELTYEAATSDDAIATVTSIEGTVVTTTAVSSDTSFAHDTTTITVTATDPSGESVTQEATVLVANSDYEVWDLIAITEEGGITASLGGLTVPLTGCFTVNNTPLPPAVYTAHWTAWQVRKGTGWVIVPGTYTELEVCPWDGMADAPAGTYRLVGELTIDPDGTGDEPPERSRRKSSNDIIKTDN